MMNRVSLLAVVFALGCGGSTKPAVEEPVAPVAEASAPATMEPVTPAEPPAPPAPPEPGDPAEVGPTIYKVVLENETVRVFEVTFKPGESIAVHKHPDHAAYVLTPGKLKVTPTEGAPMELDLTAGQAVFLPAQAHATENIGTTEVKLVVAELRKKGTAAPEGKDAVAAGPKVYKMVLDDPHVRVLEVSFKKGAKVPVHAHPDHVAYIVTGGTIKIAGADGKAQDMPMAAGQAVFLPASVHSASNAGKETVKAVIFEVRP